MRHGNPLQEFLVTLGQAQPRNHLAQPQNPRIIKSLRDLCLGQRLGAAKQRILRRHHGNKRVDAQWMGFDFTEKKLYPKVAEGRR
jgi:hypothetical protein